MIEPDERSDRPAPPDDRLARAGELAVAEADRMFALDVRDPRVADDSPDARRCKAVISAIVAANGWHDKVPYLGDGFVQWCTMFDGDCWRKAGLDPTQLAAFWASTIRLRSWARYEPFNGHANPRPPAGPYRMLVELDEHSRGPVRFPDGSAPRVGDVLTIGPVRFPNGKRALACGVHGCLIRSYNEADETFSTVEGNGVGIGPRGNRMQGIVHGVHPVGASSPLVYCARMVIRPAPHDLISAG